jgi:predicted RNase H-like nuclease
MASFPGGMGGGRSSGLPYQILAGVEPCPGGWLVAPGNLQGITVSPQPGYVLSSLADVLDYRPSFSVVALHAPVGLMDEPDERRLCDRTARDLLGVRAGAAVPAPSRPLLDARTFDEAKEIDPSLDIVRWRSLPKAVEAIREVQSWRQRAVWEVNPELAFRQMNDGEVLSYGRRSVLGLQERRRLLETKLPGTERVLRARPKGVREGKLLDALADLWTARRVMARAITRLADPPAWDNDGVRMDIVC